MATASRPVPGTPPSGSSGSTGSPASSHVGRTSAATDDPLDWPRGGLSAHARRVAWAATEALLADLDERGRLVPASREVCERAVGWLDHSLGRGSGDLRRGFLVLATLLDLLPPVVLGERSRMTNLPLDRRVAYLEALEHGKNGFLSMLLVAFKVPLAIPAFEEGEELASTGFDRPSVSARRKLPVTIPSPEGRRGPAPEEGR